MRHRLIWWVIAVTAVVPAFGDSISVNLGSASSFGLLGGTISNTGTSEVAGNVGATITTTGFTPGTATGTVYPGSNGPTTIVGEAYSDFETAYTTALGLANTQPPSLNSLPLTKTFTGDNVYNFDTTVSTTTGTVLTFDAQNIGSEVFVIQVDGDFTVNGSLAFNLINGAKADNIFWIVKNDATISVGSSGAITFDGSILAGDTFTMSAASGGSGVLAGTINGCVFSENANTLAGQTDVNGCVGGGSGGGPGGGGNAPEPGSAGLMSLGCLLGIVAWRKFRVSV